MKNIREIVSANLYSLRKQNKLTQYELSEKINYSDKAISRWEKGEVMPDLETLENLSNIYGVSIAFILEDHQPADFSIKEVRSINNQKLATALLAIMVVWLVATVIFVYMQMILNLNYWQIFVWAVPASAIVGQFFNTRWGKKINNIYFSSLIVWSILACIYLQFLSKNIWLIFIIGIPSQICLIISSLLKKSKKH